MERSQRDAARYARLKEQGRCPGCMEKAGDRVYCDSCSNRKNEYERTARQRPARERSEINGYGCHGSPKWRELEARMNQVCSRCFLRGDHTCLPDHADGTLRRGPGRLYPDMR